MLIPGCTRGLHSQEKPKAEPPTSGGGFNPTDLKMDITADGHETYSTTSAHKSGAPILMPMATPIAAPQPVVVQEEEDDTTALVQVGTPCKRRGCNTKFVSEEESRGDGQGSLCTYHPAPPLFREGSKGYLCCKRRVLEFDEFLKIKGCKTGQHLFVPRQPKNLQGESVTCRIDHYQTPTQVHVTVFAKQTDTVTSKVQLEESKIHLDLVMPGLKRFQRTIDLYGPIDPTVSTYMFLGSKVEIVLAKADTRSWLFLEKTDRPTVGYNLTFGVGGRTGTVGGKEFVLSEDNKSRTN